jgi:hypothetical protein
MKANGRAGSRQRPEGERGGVNPPVPEGERGGVNPPVAQPGGSHPPLARSTGGFTPRSPCYRGVNTPRSPVLPGG